MRLLLCTTLTLSLSLFACGDDGGGPLNEGEVITTVVLTFAPEGGGAPNVATWNDPDGDGGAAPTIDSIGLVAGTTYRTTVVFENRLESPPEDITAEILDESDEHQVFFTGPAVDGPASNRPGAALTHLYDDEDANALPVGLVNVFTVMGSPGGDLIVTLRHLPPVNGEPTKRLETADDVRTGGFGAIGGDTDAQVTFPVAVAVPGGAR